MKKTLDEMPENEISEVIDVLFNAWRNGNQIFIMGNGGSASTATHFACDLAKATVVPGKKRFKAIAWRWTGKRRYSCF